MTRIVKLSCSLLFVVACSGGDRPVTGQKPTDDPPTDAGPSSDAGPNVAPDGTIDSPSMAVTIAAGESVDFAASCADPEARPTTHAWEFGAGGPAASTVEDPGPVAFDTGGTYEVSYVCRDDRGLADPTPATVMITVIASAPPVARIDTPAGDVTIASGSSVDFFGTCTDPDGDAVTHAWRFGLRGPLPSSEEDPGAVVFRPAGTYEVTYTCRDEAGLMSTPATVRVTVPSARFHPVLIRYDRTSLQSQLALVDLENLGTLVAPVGTPWPNDTTATANLNTPELSPDGRYVAFSADATIDGVEDVYVMDLTLETATAINLTNYAAEEDGAMVLWSPDSQKIAVSRRRTEGTTRVHALDIIDISAGLGAAVTTRAFTPAPGRAGVWPDGGGVANFPDGSWSPDSTRIYFLDRGTPSVLVPADAYMFDLTAPGAGAVLLHPPSNASRGAFMVQSLGASIVILMASTNHRDARDVYAVDVRRMTPGPMVRLNPTPATGRRNTVWPHFGDRYLVSSPRQDRLAFISTTESGGGEELFVVDMSDGIPDRAGTAVRVQPAFDPRELIRMIHWTNDNHLAYMVSVELIEAMPVKFDLRLTDCSEVPCTAPAPPHQFEDRHIHTFTLAQSGDALAFVVGGREFHEPSDVHYVDLTAGAPWASVVLNRPVDAGVGCIGQPFFLSTTRVMYGCRQSMDASASLWMADADTPGEPVQLTHPDFDPSGIFNLRTDGGSVAILGGERLLLRSKRGLADFDGVFVDVARPGVHIPLHPPLSPGQNLVYIVPVR